MIKGNMGKNNIKYLIVTLNVFVISLFSVLVLSFLITRVLGIKESWITLSSFPSNLFWIPSLILFVSFVIIPTMWEWFNERKSIFTFFHTQRPIKPLLDLGVSVVAIVVMLVWLKLTMWFLQLPPEKVMMSFNEKLRWFFHLGVLAFSEEFLFRIFMQERMMKVLSIFSAILLTALVFAFVLHASEMPVVNLLVRFPLSILIGYIYYIRRNIFPCFLIHFIYDFTTILGVV